LDSPDAVRLILALNSELKAASPDPGSTHFSLNHEQVAAGQGAFFIASLDGLAVGCGAIRRLDSDTAELKRMYVDPQFRGGGVGRALVEALEREARALGVTRVVLETGIMLARAIRLYEGVGYVRIPLFGEYLRSPETSVCFSKSLRPAP
jgi:GNAT superfamily N-acetyltransferase